MKYKVTKFDMTSWGPNIKANRKSKLVTAYESPWQG